MTTVCKKREAHSLDFGDFRQIILYLGLSTWTHIEYIINVVRWHILSFCFFRLTICIPFFIRKKSTFYRTGFFFINYVRCTPLINMFGSKSRTLRQHNSRLFISTTSLAHCVWTFLCNDILLMHRTYRPTILVFCYNWWTW